MSNIKLSLFILSFMLLPSSNVFARYAAIVIDADNGKVIHEIEAGQRWYPASLTKVMTLYMTFAALNQGKIDLSDILTVSKHAAQQPNSRLGLRYGQTITVEQAILAVTTRSANDAAVLLAETLGRTESNFAAMMSNQAKRLGMSTSSFANASGLPDEGQISSARDLAILSQALIHDFPQYYHYFSATEFVYKGRVLTNTNQTLKNYPNADGMKTGFTCGSGYNLIASAKRNGHRLVGVLLGAHSSAERFNEMANLLDLGFEKINDNGLHISELKADLYSPPPFQLSSNRCAGSALQMGADNSTNHRYEPIHIKPAVYHPTTNPSNISKNTSKQASAKEISGHFRVFLGSFTTKHDAQHRLDHLTDTVSNGFSGAPELIESKHKGKSQWQVVWTKINQETDAKALCHKLHSKIRDCAVITERTIASPITSKHKHRHKA